MFSSAISLCGVAQRVEKARGAFDGDDAALRAHDFGQIGRCVAWTAADVDDGLALGDAGAAPGVQHARAPDAMLQTKARDFGVMRSQDVVAFAHRRLRSAVGQI